MTDSYDALVGGVADIAFFPPPMIEKPFPIATIPALFWSSVSAETMSKAWFNSVYKKGYLDKDFSAIKILMAFIGTPGDIETIKPVNTIDDLKGVKLANAQGPICIELADKLGAVSVTAGPPDAYLMLQKGIVDGVFVSALGLKEFHWWDFVKYMLPIQVSHMSHIVGMNLDVFNKMPDDVKTIVNDMAADEKYSLITPKGHDALYNDAVQSFLTEGGGQKITWDKASMDKLNEIIAPLWSENIAKLQAQEQGGVQVKQVVDELYNAMKALGVEPSAIAYGYTPGG
jgi:TRAP-type C4-dicarboxylate transport system substrate-binding protein